MDRLDGYGGTTADQSSLFFFFQHSHDELGGWLVG